EKFAVSHSIIDPELLKVGVFGLIALAVVAAIGWGIWNAAQDTGPALAPSSVNPLAPVQSNATPAPPTPAAQAPVDKPEEPPPTAAVTEFRADKPFPGIDQAARDAGVADVPAWVYEVRAAEPPQPQIVAVTDGQSASQALSQLPPAGGIIEFRSAGPHAIDTLEIAGGDVTLRAAQGEHPILDLTNAAQGKIALAGGRLLLDGLHIVASGRNRIRTDAIISAESATIVIRNCTITLADPASTSVPAIALARSTAGPSRCLMEDVIVRGNNLSVGLLEGPAQELVAGNCLFATGDAPAFMFVEPAATGLDSADAASSVQLLASLLMSRSSVLAGEQRDASTTPAVAFRARRTLLLGEGSSSTAIRLAPWPQSPAADLDQPRAAGVKLSLEQSTWQGWTALTEFRDLAGGDPAHITGDADWLQFWRMPLGQHSQDDPGGPWATRHSDHQLLGTPLPAEIDAALASAASAAGGFNAEALPEIPDSTISRLVAASARPRVPSDAGAAIIGPVVTYELARNGLKLNKLLNGPDCPDGAHVILTGKKRAVIEPVLLQGKSLRIEFDGGGEPLTVEPAPRSSGGRPEALFRVEQGNLDLVNARLRIPPSETSSFPLRLVQVIDGSVSIRHCVLYGQVGAGAQETPTVDWQGGGDVDRFALVEDSLIVGQSQAIGGQLQGHLMELRNSVVASGGAGVQITAIPAGRPATLTLSHCTLSGAATCFRFDLPASHENSLLQVFVDHSVYGPPLVESADPVLLAMPNDREPSAVAPVVWWENDTAVSDRINRQHNNVDWQNRWGADHVSNSVTGPLAVILSAKQIELSKALPADFLLDPQCAAATAATGGGPLGAVIDAARSGGPPPAGQPTSPAPGPPRHRTQPNV
ncbi:MAG: hypothetical protein JNG89_16605, partial [Planctomycetaceae bacterium]|nr:hypothetical protein [Planctomycetaceae bacterium]